jgi:hypothetical protein
MQTMQMIFNGLIVLFTFVTTLYVIFQHKLEKRKFKLDAYPKRFEILTTIQNCIFSIGRSADDSKEAMFTLIRNTQNASFIFNRKDQIKEYIDVLYKKGINLAFKQQKLDNIDRNKLKIKECDRIHLIKEIYESEKWFLDQNDVVKKKFSKYLQIEK